MVEFPFRQKIGEYMITLKLTPEERNKILLLRKTRSALAERAYFILLCNEEFSIEEISQKSGRHPHTIRTWIKAYSKHGIPGLKNKKPPGRSPVKREMIEKAIESLLSQSPRNYDFQEEGWTIPMLIHHFSNEGLITSEHTVRRALHKKKWVYKRFAKSVPQKTLSKDEKKEKIEALKEQIKKDSPDEIFFVDESNFTTGPYVQRGWFKKGEKKSPGPHKKDV